jgi:hypothetical protein
MADNCYCAALNYNLREARSVLEIGCGNPIAHSGFALIAKIVGKMFAGYFQQFTDH